MKYLGSDGIEGIAEGMDEILSEVRGAVQALQERVEILEKNAVAVRYSAADKKMEFIPAASAGEGTGTSEGGNKE